MAPPSAKKLALELAEIAASRALLESARGRQALSEALASQSAQITAQAAKVLAEHQLGGFEEALRAAYRALAGERASSVDPGSFAKKALLIALNALEDTDAELFAEASLYVQLERVKGSLRDSAAGVRAHGVLGLARLGHPDLLPILGACLADRDPTVRLSATRALAHRGDREGAGLLLLRLGVGDDTPEVVTECIHGLFAIAPEFGLRHVRAALRTPNPQDRELTLHALGSAPHDGAVELLAEELEKHSLAKERQPVVEALGLSLRPRARSLLLELVGSDRTSDAEAALAALAIHRYDARLVAQIGELTAHSRELTRLVRELFSD